MTETDLEKLLEIRKLLKEAYDHYFENDLDGSHKSQEGHISVEFGNYWEDEKCELKITSVNIYSYVFGNSRSHCYGSLDEALEVVRRWHKDEMETDWAEQRRLEAEYDARFPRGRTYIKNEEIYKWWAGDDEDYA